MFGGLSGGEVATLRACLLEEPRSVNLDSSTDNGVSHL